MSDGTFHIVSLLQIRQKLAHSINRSVLTRNWKDDRGSSGYQACSTVYECVRECGVCYKVLLVVGRSEKSKFTVYHSKKKKKTTWGETFSC